MAESDPGKYTKRITVQKVKDDVAISDSGEVNTIDDDQWENVVERWASVGPITGRETWLVNHADAEISHEVKMRYLEGMTSRYRILFQGRKLNIVSVMNPEELHFTSEMILACNERLLE